MIEDDSLLVETILVMRWITLLLIYSSIIFCSCNNESNTEQFNAISQSLERSNQVIIEDNNRVAMELEQQTQDVVTSARASAWMPLVKNINMHAQKMNDYIDSLKSPINSKDITVNPGIERSLFTRLKQCRENMLDDLDTLKFSYPEMRKLLFDQRVVFSNKIPLFEINIRSSTHAEEIMKLNKLKNDVLIAQNMLVWFCRDEIADADYFYQFHELTVIRSIYVKAGQENEITAGMGIFNTTMRPSITINNMQIPCSSDGTATYKFIATGKPGKYTIPVKISYIDLDGKRKTSSREINYYIAN